MEYNKIIAVTGLPGLFELLSSKSDGAIVRSLDDKTTRFVSSRVHNFSHLESIEVYTVRDNVNLAEILKAMEASKDKLPDDKDANALKAYFSKVYPDLDFTRVYSSDLKKMVKWFAVLKANDIEIKLTEPEPDGQEGSGEAQEAAMTESAGGMETAAKAPAGKGTSGGKAKSAAPEIKVPAAEQKATEKSAEKKEKAPATRKPAVSEADEKAGKKAVARSSGKAGPAKDEKEKKGSAKKTDKPKKA